IYHGEVVMLDGFSGSKGGLFYINEHGELICRDPLAFKFDGAQDIIREYKISVARRDYSSRSGKPRPTALPERSSGIKQPAPLSTINSKAAGRLLTAGGIYNGNPEGFRQTAEQLGGDTPAGYDQMMSDQAKGLVIAGASVAVVFGMGRLNPANAIETLPNLSKQTKPLLSDSVKFESRQLQKKFKHTVDFNVSGNANVERLKAFEQALKRHIDHPLTHKITGKYRWNQDVYHYYNPETKLDVMTNLDGNFISGWKLSKTQIVNLNGE
ncbi:colicin D domain-containing protein, partial [Mixta theicola]